MERAIVMQKVAVLVSTYYDAPYFVDLIFNIVLDNAYSQLD